MFGTIYFTCWALILIIERAPELFSQTVEVLDRPPSREGVLRALPEKLRTWKWLNTGAVPSFFWLFVQVAGTSGIATGAQGR